MKEIYWYIVIASLLCGIVIPQEGAGKKLYIFLMTLLHTVVSACRYKFLTGDLLKYNTEFQDVRFFSYFSKRVLQDGRNTGFYWVMKVISDITNGNFQVLLIATSIIIEIAVAIVIYRYSTRPWLSYLVWNCFGFYIFGFSAVKQAFAMAFVLLAAIGIFEEKPVKFIIYTGTAAFLHMPAIAFLPAYWIAKRRIKIKTILSYVVFSTVIFVFRNPLVSFLTNLYYEEDEFLLASDATLGGRFFMMVLILIAAILIKGFGDRNFEKMFNLLVVAAIFQMFSGFDNVFTRFADYYFQFTILFVPLMFSCEDTDTKIRSTNRMAFLPFNEQSLRVFTLMLMFLFIWYYHVTTLARPIDTSIHDYLNYHFMWDESADAWRQE